MSHPFPLPHRNLSLALAFLTKGTDANNQDLFLELESFEMSDERYNDILSFGRTKSRDEGVDKVMREHNINLIIGPSDSALFCIASLAGEFSLCGGPKQRFTNASFLSPGSIPDRCRAVWTGRLRGEQ